MPNRRYEFVKKEKKKVSKGVEINACLYGMYEALHPRRERRERNVDLSVRHITLS